MAHSALCMLLLLAACEHRGDANVAAPAPAPTPAAPVATIPDTPAGRALQAWLDAFNSAEPARIAAYHTKLDPEGSPDHTLAFRTQTGGFELVEIEASAPHRVAFVVKEKASPVHAVGELELAGDDGPAKLSLQAIPPGLTAADMRVELDDAARVRVIDGVIAKLTESYVFPDVAKRMGDALRDHQQRGDYDQIRDGHVFAALLTEHLRAVSHDLHLGVHCVPRSPKQPEGSDARAEATMRAELERTNCTFAKPERIAPGIGYLKFDMFAPVEICGPAATAAFAELAGVDALIVDLRGNGGGEPEMVAFVSSYLFAERTHLNDIYERVTDETTEYWTKPDVPGEKLADVPVFVLTSKHTFSGAEEFSYNLKMLKRATLVGETTGGGAHPTRGIPVDDRFMIGVPFARAVNPISKTNWEGTGVTPDVEAPADRALDVAKELAAKRIAERAQKPAKRRR